MTEHTARYVYRTHNIGFVTCCEAQMYYRGIGRVSSVINKFCDVCKGPLDADGNPVDAPRDGER